MWWLPSKETMFASCILKHQYLPHIKPQATEVLLAYFQEKNQAMYLHLNCSLGLKEIIMRWKAGKLGTGFSIEIQIWKPHLLLRVIQLQEWRGIQSREQISFFLHEKPVSTSQRAIQDSVRNNKTRSKNRKKETNKQGPKRKLHRQTKHNWVSLIIRPN